MLIITTIDNCIRVRCIGPPHPLRQRTDRRNACLFFPLFFLVIGSSCCCFSRLHARLFPRTLDREFVFPIIASSIGARNASEWESSCEATVGSSTCMHTPLQEPRTRWHDVGAPDVVERTYTRVSVHAFVPLTSYIKADGGTVSNQLDPNRLQLSGCRTNDTIKTFLLISDDTRKEQPKPFNTLHVFRHFR